MLLLDSEALSALAHGPAPRRERVRVLLIQARLRREKVGTAAAVLAEVVRGRPGDAAIFGVLRRDRVEVLAVDRSVGVAAGRLLGALGVGSEMAVDAFVIATAELAGGALVATVDADDLTRLAARAHAPIAVVGI